MNVMTEIEKEINQVNREINFEIGDTVKVFYKIIEGTKERIQLYEGIVIAIDNTGIGQTFTVRKISFDVGVERIFPVQTNKISKIEVIKKGKSRRSKLYFLRKRTGKSARLKESMTKTAKFKESMINNAAAEQALKKAKPAE